MTKTYTRAAAIAAALTMATATMPASADVKDYEFQLVSQEVRKGDAVIAVKLVHKPSGRAIPDAVIFAKRIDMGRTKWPTCRRNSIPCPALSPASTNSRPIWRWRGAGP